MDPLSWLYARQGRFAPGLERIRALLARLGHPEEVANAAVFLCSGAASWVTGQTLIVDGGQMLG